MIELINQKQKKRVVANLIRNPTLPEKKLEAALAKYGIKYVFQKPFDIKTIRHKNGKTTWPRTHFYVVDFYLPDKRAAIEIDGDIHTKQQQYDIKRTQQLLTASTRMLKYIYRFHNNEVIHDLKNVIGTILSIRICRGQGSKNNRHANQLFNQKLMQQNQIKSMIHLDPDLTWQERKQLIKATLL